MIYIITYVIGFYIGWGYGVYLANKSFGILKPEENVCMGIFFGLFWPLIIPGIIMWYIIRRITNV